MLVFGVQNVLKIVLFLNLFPVHFLWIADLIFRRLGFKNRCFRIECIAQKTIFHGDSFLRISDSILNVFCLGIFSVFQASKTGLNTEIFLVKNLFSSTGSGEADLGVFGPSEDLKA